VEGDDNNKQRGILIYVRHQDGSVQSFIRFM